MSHKASRWQGYSGFKHFLVSSPSEYVASVEINRPDRLNAFFEEMWVELREIFARLSQDPEVRAVVLSGAGDRAFTSGLDVKAAGESALFSEGPGLDVSRRATQTRRYIFDFQDCISQVERCEKREPTHSSLFFSLFIYLLSPPLFTVNPYFIGSLFYADM